MKSIIWSPKAIFDARSIGEHTNKICGAKQRRKYLDALERRIFWLAENPNLGKHRPEINNDYFSYPEGEHIIFYRKGSDAIEIIGILHNRMDVASNLHGSN